MLTRTLARIGAAATLALALLVATAVPTSASATGVVIDGSSTIDFSDGGGWFDLDQHVQAHSTANVCAPSSTTPPTIPVSFDSSGGGTVGAATMPWHDAVFSTTTFKGRLIIDSGTITLSASGISIALVVRFEYRTCNSLTHLCTTNPVSMTVSGPSVGHHPTASTRVTVHGISGHVTVVAVPACNLNLRAALTSQTPSVSLNLHFV